MGLFSFLFPKREEQTPEHLELAPRSGAGDEARIAGGWQDSRGLPRFREVASSQLHNVGITEGDRARRNLCNAFTPSNPVLDAQQFAGREQVLLQLIRGIESLRLHGIIYGERGIGKTSMLMVLSQLAREAHYHVCYYSCGENSGFSDAFRSILSDIPLLYHNGYSPTSPEVESGAKLSDVLPEGALSAVQISDTLLRLHGTRVIIILDEFDRSPEGNFRRSIAELIKNLSDRSVPVQIVIGGVASNLAELVEHIPSIRRNILGLRVPNMEDEEVAEMIRLGERLSGVDYQPAAVDDIIAVSQGSPSIASLVGQRAGFAAVERGRLTVTQGDVHAAVSEVAIELEGRLADRVVERVRAARAAGYADWLAGLAGEALVSMGRFRLMEGAAGPVGAALIENFDLIEADSSGEQSCFRFRDEGAPTYIWMLHMCDRLEKEGSIRSEQVA